MVVFKAIVAAVVLLADGFKVDMNPVAESDDNKGFNEGLAAGGLTLNRIEESVAHNFFAKDDEKVVVVLSKEEYARLFHQANEAPAPKVGDVLEKLDEERKELHKTDGTEAGEIGKGPETQLE